MKSNLSRAIEAYYDEQVHAEGPWANAWAPVWEKTATAHRAAPHQWAGLSVTRAAATFTPANAPETEQEETLYA